MATPTITINGKEIEMKKLTARIWRETTKENEKRKDLSSAEAIDIYCAVIATAFGVTADEVLDNLYIEDIMPKYFEVLNSINTLITAKLPKKNATPAAEKN